MYVKESIFSDVRYVKPKPITVAIREVVSEDVIRFGRDGFKEYVKQYMASKLAQYIVNECSIFEPPTYEDVFKGKQIALEITINDRGAYENYIATARDEGHRDGRMAALKQLPYGMNPNEFYE